MSHLAVLTLEKMLSVQCMDNLSRKGYGMGAKPVVFNLPLRRTGSGVRAVRLHNRDTHYYARVAEWLKAAHC